MKTLQCRSIAITKSFDMKNNDIAERIEKEIDVLRHAPAY